MSDGCVGSVNWTWDACKDCVHLMQGENCRYGWPSLDELEEDCIGDLICQRFSDKEEWESTGEKPIYDPLSATVSQAFMFKHAPTTPFNTVVNDDGEVMVKRGETRNLQGGL